MSVDARGAALAYYGELVSLACAEGDRRGFRMLLADLYDQGVADGRAAGRAADSDVYRQRVDELRATLQLAAEQVERRGDRIRVLECERDALGEQLAALMAPAQVAS